MMLVDPIPFRRRVFPSSLDGEHITSKIVKKLIDSKSFDRLHDDDAISLCCVGILQLVFLSMEGRRIVPDWILRLANDRVGWDKYPWGSYVWPTLYLQLKDANVRRWPSLYASQPIDQVDKKRIRSLNLLGHSRAAAWSKKGRFLRRMVVDFFHGNLHVARLTPDCIEARYEWWISSKAYFDGVIDQAE
nr:phospholipase-like protein [Tanacetum cinerariifolium]